MNVDCSVLSTWISDDPLVIPDTDLALVRQWIDAQHDSLPEAARGLIRYDIDVADQSITIVESRPPWREEYDPEWTWHEVARLRLDAAGGEWSLYWYDRYGRSQPYGLVGPTRQVEKLLAEIDDDPTAIFWG